MIENQTNPEKGGNGVRAHLEQLGDASGCTETWVHLSKYRQEEPNQQMGT